MCDHDTLLALPAAERLPVTELDRAELDREAWLDRMLDAAGAS